MAFMLASVAGAEEAEIAIRHGADIVDLKDVRTAFGAVPTAVVRATVDMAAGRRPVSAVAGEIDMAPDAIARRVAELADAGVSYVKIGLYPDDRRGDCIRALSSLTGRLSLIAVTFADHGFDKDLVPLLAQSGFAGAMIDTAFKTGKRLLDHMDIAVIGEFVDAVRMHGMMTGLAGSLEAPDIPRLLLLSPDVLGFRRALCGGEDRAAHIDAEAIDIVRAMIPLDLRKLNTARSAIAKVDYRLLAVRGYSLDQREDGAESDRIFVRDFVLPVRIGAYVHERSKPQSVRFNVDVKVFRPNQVQEDIRDVLSYDVITDSIRMIVAQEHIALAETLAERIAAVILTHPRVAGLTVRVEKLEVGAGVEITRRRLSETAKVHHLYPAAMAETGPKTGS
jgi:(5-formylfuran-3-yl)methyl phosphate synthase